jgi:hypothetical protein
MRPDADVLRIRLAQHPGNPEEPAMTSVPITRETDVSASSGRSASAWWASTRAWAGISIVAMWTAVLFVGVFGPDFVSASATDRTAIPSVVLVAVCAMVGTITVTHAALRGGDDLRR